MHWFDKYADEIVINAAIEATIDTCIEHGDTKEETLKYVSKKFPQVSKQHISERISELWDEK